MIPVPSGVRVWIATGHTDMRRGMNSLALLVQEAFKRDPHGGDLYVFRGKSGKLIKILSHDGLGMSLYATTCIHTTPLSASAEGFSTTAILRAAARSTRRFHRLHCLRGGFDSGISYI
jgi:transposase